VGVTGHRPNRLSPDVIADVPAQCEQVLQAIAALAAQAHDDLLHAPGPPLLRIISPLAEGADRIVAQAGLQLGADLQCPLPFEAEEYSRDFVSEGSREEFNALLARASAIFECDGRRDAEDVAYENVGRMVIEQSDFLIAIWDGKPAAGRGGTPQVIEEALAQNVPVIWLHAAEPRAPLILLADEDGTRRQYPLEKLAEILGPRFTEITGEDEASATQSHDYCLEKQPRFDAGRIFRIFRDLIARGQFRKGSWEVADFEPSTRRDWEESILRGAEVPEATRVYLLDGLGPHYAWADGLSVNYSGWLRSTSLGTSLLSACAVLVPMVGYLLRAAYGIENQHRIPPLLEFSLIVAILWITHHGQKQRWHERWLNYRQLAELLRQYCYLAPLGCPLPSPRPPAHVGADPHRSWVDGMFRTIARDLGIPPANAKPVYLRAMGKMIDNILEGQVGYHKSNYKVMHKLSHRVHWLGTCLFVLTLLACITHVLIPREAPSWVEPWLELLAVVPPAFGAAFYAITIQGEFARSADRSEAMGEELNSLRENDLSEAIQSAPQGSAALRQAAQRIAATMIAETMDWSFVFRYRKLNLPG
jgi:hypothetical protein